VSPFLGFDVANTIVKMYNIQDVRKCGGLLWFRGMQCPPCVFELLNT